MQPECRKYVYDIQKAGEQLALFTAGKTFADYQADSLLRSGVERQFEIVGEALSQMLKLDSTLADVITDARRIIAFRNILIHGYATVSNEVVWGIVERGLPTLRREVTDLLK
jgi:uncharacterized protein with HEPN domain